MNKQDEKEKERQEALDYLERSGAFKEIGWIIGNTARGVHRRFANYLQLGDVEQNSWEWVLRAPIKVARWHKDLDEEGFQRMLGSVLWDEGTFIGRKTRRQILGGETDDEFFYTKGMLMTLLPDVYNDEAWVNGPNWQTKGQSKVREGKALNEGFGWVATLSDVSRALSRIPLADREVLRLTYAEGLTRGELAQQFGVAGSTISDRHNSAIKKLWAVLGGPKWLSRTEDREDDDGHWPVGRRAMSNAEARYVTASEAEMR